MTCRLGERNCLCVCVFVSKQEGWLSPTERASVSAISLRDIIWLPHESHAAMSLPSAVAGAAIWLRRESKAHFDLRWVRPWDNRDKYRLRGIARYWSESATFSYSLAWIEREFDACQTPRSMYRSIFNRFPVIQAVSLNVRHFSTFLPALGTPLGQSR